MDVVTSGLTRMSLNINDGGSFNANQPQDVYERGAAQVSAVDLNGNGMLDVVDRKSVV